MGFEVGDVYGGGYGGFGGGSGAGFFALIIFALLLLGLLCRNRGDGLADNYGHGSGWVDIENYKDTTCEAKDTQIMLMEQNCELAKGEMRLGKEIKAESDRVIDYLQQEKILGQASEINDLKRRLEMIPIMAELGRIPKKPAMFAEVALEKTIGWPPAARGCCSTLNNA